MYTDWDIKENRCLIFIGTPCIILTSLIVHHKDIELINISKSKSFKSHRMLWAFGLHVNYFSFGLGLATMRVCSLYSILVLMSPIESGIVSPAESSDQTWEKAWTRGQCLREFWWIAKAHLNLIKGIFSHNPCMSCRSEKLKTCLMSESDWIQICLKIIHPTNHTLSSVRGVGYMHWITLDFSLFICVKTWKSYLSFLRLTLRRFINTHFFRHTLLHSGVQTSPLRFFWKSVLGGSDLNLGF